MQRATGTAPASSEPPDWIVPVLLQEPLGEGPQASVRCLTCERRCVVAPGKTGWCRTRQNCGGHLYTLIYGIASSLSANPIEKKPLYHFYPGSVALTVGSWSCNFACPWCQNWEISKASPFGGEFFSRPLRCGDGALALPGYLRQFQRADPPAGVGPWRFSGWRGPPASTTPS